MFAKTKQKIKEPIQNLWYAILLVFTLACAALAVAANAH